MILPDHPARLTPGAARALLRVLLKAHDRLAATEATERGDAEMTSLAVGSSPENVVHDAGQSSGEPGNFVPVGGRRSTGENAMNVTVNGWTYDPVEQAWTARVAEGRWLVLRSDIDDPPTFRPEAAR